MIRRGLALTLLLIGVSPAPTLAQATAPQASVEPLTVAPGREGYAFDRPRVLAQQRLLGVAHGVSLLASACMDDPAHLDATLAAFVPWRESQEATIVTAQRDLARHYFGARASEARWPELVRALNLKNQLDLAPGSKELAAACATLPTALRRPRYALATQFRLHGLLAEATTGIEAELRGGWCRERLDGLARQVFDARFDVWYELNAPRATQAAEVLRTEWPVEAPAESFELWEQELRRDARVLGRAEDCLGFSESLKRPQAALRSMFAPPTEVAP